MLISQEKILDVSNLATASRIRVCQDSKFLESSEIRPLLHQQAQYFGDAKWLQTLNPLSQDSRARLFKHLREFRV